MWIRIHKVKVHAFNWLLKHGVVNNYLIYFSTWLWRNRFIGQPYTRITSEPLVEKWKKSAFIDLVNSCFPKKSARSNSSCAIEICRHIQKNSYWRSKKLMNSSLCSYEHKIFLPQSVHTNSSSKIPNTSHKTLISCIISKAPEQVDLLPNTNKMKIQWFLKHLYFS